MKKLSLLILSLLWLSQAWAQNLKPDQTLSPYFLVKSEGGGKDLMPLKHTSAEVSIAGVIADVRVQQVYVNEGEATLEAIYVFPGSTRAAVYGMQMSIGERKLFAKIEERKKAREDYEQAKSEGKTASLLEQQNPNVFQMNVANILPGDSITVELQYTELLEPDEGTYEFVYPTVVGPRYSDTPVSQATASEKWVENPYLKEGEAPNYTFHLRTVLNAGMPIQQISSSSHKVNIRYSGKNKASIQLMDSEKFAGNKDFILKYRLNGGQIQSGILLYEEENAVASGENRPYLNPESEKFFLLMMQAPKAPKLDQIPPREYVFVIDVSGSMNGFPLDISKALLRELIGNLRPTDRFNVMLFESSNQMLSEESMLANESNIEKAMQVIDQQKGGGGTRLMPALKTAFDFQQTKKYSRTFVVVTDGYISVEREAFDLIRNRLDEANLFAFGIGSSVNRYLIEGMARMGQGQPFIITKTAEAKAIANKFRKYIQTPVLTNIKVEYEGFEVYGTAPQKIGDVFADKPIILYGKYKGQAKGSIRISGLSGNQKFSQVLSLDKAEKQNNQAIRYLWARKQIQLLDDYNKLSVNYWGRASAEQVNQMVLADPANEQRIQEVTQLGLKYNLLTAYTSFIAIDPEQRNKTGKSSTVKQALPLPEGVSDLALSGTYGGRRSKYTQRSASPKRYSPVKSREVIEEDIEDSEPVELFSSKDEKLQSRPAQFKSGSNAWERYLKAEIKKRALNCSGAVRLRFTILANGSIQNIQVLQSLSKSCDQAALEIIQKSQGNWKAAWNANGALDSTVEVTLHF